MKVVLASSNVGKIRELTALLKDFHIDLISQSELGVSEIEENGLTFVENALIKARHAAKCTGLPAIADDSGLVIPALLGAPGIYSARYAGTPSNNRKNIEKVLFELGTQPDKKREAAFHCAMVFMLHDKDPTPIICESDWFGSILHEPKGENGFGYDPIFYVSEQKKTAAELPLALKNKISHRGMALQVLIKKLAEKLCLPSSSNN